MPSSQLVVAVPTYRRPTSLDTTIRMVLEQLEDLVSSADAALSARLVVIDNDPDGSARPIVSSLGDDRVSYIRESSPGIAAARNRALDAGSDADVLVFIDDDERPRDGWLRALVETWRATGGTAVAGRVVPLYPDGVGSWIVHGRFFVRRSLPTGSLVEAAPTSNLLLDLAEMRRLGIRFDSRFGLAGGEDTLLTRQIVRAGGTIVWCDESIVEDLVPIERARARWVLRRAWSHGNATTRVDLALSATPAARAAVRARAAAGGLARIAGGAVRAVVGVVVRSDVHSARGLRAAFRGAGMVAAAAGAVYHEYARPMR